MSKVQENTTIYEFGDFCFEVAEKCLFRADKRVELTPRTFALLLMLVENSGHLLEKEALINEVWKHTNVEEGNLTRTISSLRKLLGDTKAESIYIQTVPRVGYRFIAEVRTGKLRNGHLTQQQRQPQREQIPRSISRSQVIIISALLITTTLSLLMFVNWQRLNNTDKLPDSSQLNQPKRLTTTPQNEQVTGWTNDGKLRFTKWISNDQAESYVMNADGRNQTREGINATIQIGVWSPNGDKVVFSKNGDSANNLQYIADADGANETKLPLITENPMWSGDGQKIVFQAHSPSTEAPEDVEVYIYDISFARLSRITNSPGFDGDASFSPDGERIVFISSRDGDFEVYIMNLKGEDVRRLTQNTAHDSFPRITPDGTGVTFSSNLDGETTDLYFMKTDGSGRIRLTDWTSNELTRANCSPDGTKIAFNSDKDGNDEIYIMDFDPNNAELFLEDKNTSLQTPSFSKDGKQLVYSAEFPDKTGELRILDIDSGKTKTILKTTRGSNYPRFSQDGTKIAFHQEIKGRWDVFVVNSNGEDKTNLTHNNASDSIPNWMHDGQTLIFRSNRSGGTLSSELFSMKADGTQQRPLLVRQGSLGWSTVSPDGKHIVYSCDRENVKESLLDICIADIDGSGEKILLSRNGNDMQPVFSPDGERIAFVASSDGNSEIYVMDRDGTNLFRLTRNPAKDLTPVFSSDNKSIIFSSDRNGSFALYRVMV